MAVKVRGFVDQHRGELVLAEEAYIGGRYGDLSHSRDDADSLINVARDLKILLDEMVKGVKLVRNRFEHLRRWREYVEKVAKAARAVTGDVEVYMIGGVAEERTTVLSGIDVLIVVKRISAEEKKMLYVEFLEKAIDEYGLPWDAPIELHIADEWQAEEYFKLSKNAVKINC